MISVKVFARQIEKFAVDNSPVILTGVGAIGTAVTAYLTGKAAWNANDHLDAANEERLLLNKPVINSTPDKVKLLWKDFVPAVGAGAITIASVVCATRISTKRAAALAIAYSLREKAFEEYREKVADKFTVNKERQVRDEVAQDRVSNNSNHSQIVIVGNGDVLCYDMPSDRYFVSNMEKIRSVVNDINASVCEFGQATLSDLYVALGLKDTPWATEIGWTTEALCELKYSTALDDQGRPCIVIDHHAKPTRGSARFQGCTDDPGF